MKKVLCIQTRINNFFALCDTKCALGSEKSVVIIFHLVCCTRFMY